jgi:hypothetical protein
MHPALVAAVLARRKSRKEVAMIAHRGIAQSALVIGFFILSVGLVTGTAEAKPPKRVTVDCTAGDTIADALTKSRVSPSW